MMSVGCFLCWCLVVQGVRVVFRRLIRMNYLMRVMVIREKLKIFVRVDLFLSCVQIQPTHMFWCLYCDFPYFQLHMLCGTAELWHVGVWEVSVLEAFPNFSESRTRCVVVVSRVLFNLTSFYVYCTWRKLISCRFILNILAIRSQASYRNYAIYIWWTAILEVTGN